MLLRVQMTFSQNNTTAKMEFDMTNPQIAQPDSRQQHYWQPSGRLPLHQWMSKTQVTAPVLTYLACHED